MATLTNPLIPSRHRLAIDIGLFILRSGVGLLMIPHGLKKLLAFGDKAQEFYNFLNLGGQVSMALIIFAEFFCSILLILGLGTRLALIPLIIGMIVVVFVVQGHQPLGDKESGLLYLIPYIVLFITGPGKYSLDHLFFGNKMKS